MASKISLDKRTYELLKHLEKKTGNSKKIILQEALIMYLKEKVIDTINAYYTALQSEPELWNEELEERELWETASLDGLKDL